MHTRSTINHEKLQFAHEMYRNNAVSNPKALIMKGKIPSLACLSVTVPKRSTVALLSFPTCASGTAFFINPASKFEYYF